MKKIIILLFLAISFVLMILISYMKFQSVLYFQSGDYGTDYYVEDRYLNNSPIGELGYGYDY